MGWWTDVQRSVLVVSFFALTEIDLDWTDLLCGIPRFPLVINGERTLLRMLRDKSRTFVRRFFQLVHVINKQN